MKIGEIARRTGLKIETVRFYEAEGLVPAPIRSGGNYRLSTSNVGYTPLFGGFAPMTKDGYGACYAMLESRINLIITSWRSCPETSSDAFRDTLARTLVDMRNLCTSGAREETPSAKL